MHLYAHRVHSVVILVLALAVLAAQALALLSTFESCAVALAIFFSALRLFTGAFSHWHKGWHILKKSRVSIIGYLFGKVYLLVFAFFVPTTSADTVLIACAPSSKAFTIQFQTIYFCTFTALMSWGLFLLFFF